MEKDKQEVIKRMYYRPIQVMEYISCDRTQLSYYMKELGLQKIGGRNMIKAEDILTLQKVHHLVMAGFKVKEAVKHSDKADELLKILR